MTSQCTIEEYLSALSSKAPVPGGGGASALAGTLGNALGQMVVSLTVGKKKYAAVEEEMKGCLARLEGLQREFLQLADEDARAFEPLSKAYSLPSQTEEEKAYKDRIMEENLLAASLVPVKIMEKSVEMMEILEKLAEKGSRLAVSDVGVGVQYTKAALLGAVMNVWINTKSMKNREKAEEINRYAQKLVSEGSKKADDIYAMVLRAIGR